MDRFRSENLGSFLYLISCSPCLSLFKDFIHLFTSSFFFFFFFTVILPLWQAPGLVKIKRQCPCSLGVYARHAANPELAGCCSRDMERCVKKRRWSLWTYMKVAKRSRRKHSTQECDR